MNTIHRYTTGETADFPWGTAEISDESCIFALAATPLSSLVVTLAFDERSHPAGGFVCDPELRQHLASDTTLFGEHGRTPLFGPHFAEKAGRALDLHARIFDGKRLRPDEYVICADEKTQLQALGRRHDTVPPGPGRPGLVEFDYLRGGTLAYLAAWDVHHAKLFDPGQTPDLRDSLHARQQRAAG